MAAIGKCSANRKKTLARELEATLSSMDLCYQYVSQFPADESVLRGCEPPAVTTDINFDEDADYLPKSTVGTTPLLGLPLKYSSR